MISLLEKVAGYPRLLRGLAALTSTLLVLFLLDNILIYAAGWPGLRQLFAHFGLASAGNSFKGLEGAALLKGGIELLICVVALISVVGWVFRSQSRALHTDADMYSAISAFVIRAAFWSVFLVGVTDMVISFLRVEGLLSAFVGESLTTQLGRSIFRGTYVHYPLIGISILIAAFTRSLGFIWLSLMIVGAEFLIVITRFVFSYEQAFMGDLVRFWYAALFLFASAYTLLHDGHVRVDVLYAGFSERGKAVTNSLGSLLLGLPICWTILILGTASKGSVINSPLLSFEISQSGFGMYTKYLMAAYLLIFAISMAIQFTSFFLGNMAKFVSQDESNSAQG
ncbi:MAG: TRAP transporter small permease subunit [Acidiferrobacterales bacterium]|nr:TRAP transporter small permease subunit [Acidiferrobacterales bacterium]